MESSSWVKKNRGIKPAKKMLNMQLSKRPHPSFLVQKPKTTAYGGKQWELVAQPQPRTWGAATLGLALEAAC